VDRILADPERALDTFVREEIGLSAQTMGSPISAGIGSLLAFSAGAFVPLVPYLAVGASLAFPLSIGLAIAALFAVGVGVSRLTHHRPIRTGLRQAALGAAAAIVTYAVGSMLGAAVHG
jgi:VIT1/CCC1 family predicted Fe2+/Mn2+ transporter